jgi:eukaryotic-like serine/threonine-protein kinase
VATEFHIRVHEVLQGAIQQLTAERSVFIDKIVGNDSVLRREVQSLLPHYLEIAGFEPKLPMPMRSKSPEATHACSRETSQDDDEWKLPFAIAPYRVVDMLGRGGMGVVYRGIHSTRPLNVAIKILRRRFVDRGYIRFKQEEELLRRLQHPGIVRFLYGGEVVMRRNPSRPVEDRRPYIVMEYIQGQSLVKYANTRSLDVLQRIALLAQICEAVEYAHHRGVVHCDLKPDNILVDVTGQPRILDFGIARLQHFGAPLVADAKHFAGTLAYASPEQRTPRDGGLSPESDVYSLGLIIHELLTGNLPKRLGTRIVLDLQSLQIGAWAAPDAVFRELQHVLRVMIATALRGTRGRRYATAGELGEDLTQVYRAFSPQTPNRFSSWITAFRKEPASSPTAHSRLLCTLLRTRIGMGIDL